MIRHSPLKFTVKAQHEMMDFTHPLPWMWISISEPGEMLSIFGKNHDNCIKKINL